MEGMHETWDGQTCKVRPKGRKKGGTHRTQNASVGKGAVIRKPEKQNHKTKDKNRPNRAWEKKKMTECYLGVKEKSRSGA